MKQRPAVGSTRIARRLRADATDAERVMWRLLRANFPDARFRRQVPLVRYVADFASHRARIVVEVDGGQHGGAADDERTRAIAAEGYRVLRFWNHDVLTSGEAVARAVAQALEEVSPLRECGDSTPTQPSPIEGEG